MKLKYIKDKYGEDLLTDENEIHQIMMEWEKNYMIKSIQELNPEGSVLEIGFGIGYSATEICKNLNVKKYTIIECSPEVWKNFEIWKKDQRDDLEINLIKGRWQDVLELVDKFDYIYFDDYVNEYNNSNQNNRFNYFLYEILVSHSKIGTKICSYSNNNLNYNNLDCIKFENILYNVDIPEHCKYAKGDKMYIPIITVINEPDIVDIKKKLLIDDKLNELVQDKIKTINNYLLTPKKIECNYIVIDNFYNNVKDVRNFILSENFYHDTNNILRTKSYATDSLKQIIQSYACNNSSSITKWDDLENSLNGSFQILNCHDNFNIQYKSEYNWIGILFLTPNAPINSGLTIFSHNDGTRYNYEIEIYENSKNIENHKYDITKWIQIDKFSNVFNRLILFNSSQFYSFINNFGINNNKANLFQYFTFNIS